MSQICILSVTQRLSQVLTVAGVRFQERYKR